MFKETWFTDGIKDSVDSILMQHGIKANQFSISERLVKLAQDNEQYLLPKKLMTREKITFKPPSMAFTSAATVAIDAVFFARKAGRDYITQEDFELAYQKNYCRIWPFCR